MWTNERIMNHFQFITVTKANINDIRDIRSNLDNSYFFVNHFLTNNSTTVKMLTVFKRYWNYGTRNPDSMDKNSDLLHATRIFHFQWSDKNCMSQ